MLVRFSQSSKAFAPMLVNPSGIIIELSVLPSSVTPVI